MGKGNAKAKKKDKTSEEPRQDSLYPLNIIAMDPKGLRGVDQDGVGTCEDLNDYVLKSQNSHPTIPHNEWFCAKLAEHVAIACPQSQVCVGRNGETYFGSRWEGGATNEPLASLIARKEMTVAQVGPILSRVLAFDMFVYNVDRHLENFVLRPTRNGWTLLCIDHGRAWLFNGFPHGALPMRPGMNTLSTYRDMVQLFGNFLDLAAANKVLDRLADTPAGKIAQIIDGHPSSWLAADMRKRIFDWWSSDERLKRIEQIRKGLGDGSYL